VAKRTVFTVIVAVILVLVLLVLCNGSFIHWDVVWHYLFSGPILSGLLVTIELTVLSMVVGIVLGVVLALMTGSSTPSVAWAARLYIWFFRGTPVLVQLIFWFNLALVVPRIGSGDWSISTNDLITPFLAAVLGLGLNEGAYMSEIIRAGIASVDRGQLEAGLAVGLTRAASMRKVVLPQALRVIVPPTGNQAIGMLKTTSLVSVIAASDLLTQAQHIYAQNFQVIDLLVVASIWYLVLTTIASVLQSMLERKVAEPLTVRARRRTTRPTLAAEEHL
jgi:polar amino acid transport system permease protein